ncbi:serine/threonine protein kinase [Candidatus Obscuribacterales bacterium]|nr:serine/threonine protein kinase [Candidatus Obscuribacterales bacterium]
MDEGNNLKAKSMAMTGGSDAQESRALSDNYVIIGPLAETAHSVVEIIREIDTGHHLLAKVLKESSPEVQERFHQAILEHGRLQHKNIVQTVDWRISESGEPVFITEFLEGVNLDQLIDEVGTLEDDEEITTFLIQVCDALEYAHSEGMMHGGLTPANIVITQPDESILVKIADFGFTNSSRELPENPDRLRATYMAPEQLKGEITEKSDVFSVAAVAYQLITGFLPYGTEGDGTQLSPIGEYRPDIPEAEKLSFVLERALQLDPDERTSSIRDFKRGVREWYQSIGDEEDEAAEESGEYESEVADESEEHESESSETGEYESNENESTEHDYSEIDSSEFDSGETESGETNSNETDYGEDQLSESESGETETEAEAGDIDSGEESFEQAQTALADLEAQADEGNFQAYDQPISEIGIVVRQSNQTHQTDEDELDYIDELDDEEHNDSLAEMEPAIAQPEPSTLAQASISSSNLNAVAELPKATGFGADISDAEFDIEGDQSAQGSDFAVPEMAPEPNFGIEPPPGFGIAASTPSFSTPPGTTPAQSFPKEPAVGDQELSGRFSRVARLPALQALPGMEASIAEPPKKETPQLELDLEREREREQIKKFKKHKKTKRNKSKINSTMTKLMALRSTQVEQSLTVSTKIAETFAEGRGKEAPKKVLLRVVASSVIGAVCVIMVLANLSVLESVWMVASRQVSSALGKKNTASDEIVTTIPGEEQLEKVDKATETKDGTNAPTVDGSSSGAIGTQPATGPQASSFATSRAERHQTHLMPVHKVIDSRNIMPKGAMTPPAPGEKRYQGAVYPYLFTDEEAHRDPKAPRATDSEVITIPSK